MAHHLTTTNMPDFTRFFIGGGDPLARFANVLQNPGNYPPYDIEQVGEDGYRLTLAIAGFSRKDVEIVREKDRLIITGHKPGEEEGSFVHRGIAQRAFERTFLLGEHMIISRASMTNGLLVIDLAREVPEADRPVTIAIQ